MLIFSLFQCNKQYKKAKKIKHYNIWRIFFYLTYQNKI